MIKIITFIILFFLMNIILYAKEPLISTNESSYTSISQKDCISLDSDNLGSVEECESFNDIGVKVIESDTREGIILTRNKKEYALDFWSTISPNFFSLGFAIEWRYEKEKPENLKGLIVRFDVSDHIEKEQEISSYLVVSKITKDEICIVAKVALQKDQHKIARDILDAKEEKACLKEIKKKK